MKCGEWLRELTSDEADWAKDCYDAMELKAKDVGYRSHDPCRSLRSDRRDYSKNNTEEKHLVGGPKRHLPPYWISFVNEHGKIPQLRTYYLAKARWNHIIHAVQQESGEIADVMISVVTEQGVGDVHDEQTQLEVIDAMKKKRALSTFETDHILSLMNEDVAVEPEYCELSHVCGDNDCIKATHIVCEKKKDNLDRYKYCHTEIRQWVNANKMNRSVTTRGLITAAAARVECGHDPQCFLNIDENRKRKLPRDIDEVERHNPRRAPKRQRVNDDMFGVKSSSNVVEHKFRGKRTVIYDGQRGWIEEVGEKEIKICLPDGARRKANSKWISKTSRHLTIPQR